MLLYKYSVKNTDKTPNSCHSSVGLKFSYLIWLKMQLGTVRREVKGVRRGKFSKGIQKLSILLMCQKKFLTYCWRNTCWEKVKLNFLFDFWKGNLGCTCWIPKNILADLAHFFSQSCLLIHFALLLHQDSVGILPTPSFIIQANAHVIQLLSNTVAAQITVQNISELPKAVVS